MKKYKIYFACSISGEQGGKADKQLIVDILKKLKQDILSEIYINYDAQTEKNKKESDAEIYKISMDWIKDANLIVADVNKISLGVGYEIGWSIRDGKKVIALCKKERWESLSPMIKGITDSNFKLYAWSDQKNLERIFIKELG